MRCSLRSRFHKICDGNPVFCTGIPDARSKPCFGGLFMHANWRVGSFIASVRVITRKRYGRPLTAMRKTRAELRPAVSIRMSSASGTPNASRRAGATAMRFASGIIESPANARDSESAKVKFYRRGLARELRVTHKQNYRDKTDSASRLVELTCAWLI